MSASNRIRFAVAGGAALLCAGVSVPAVAHGTQDPTEPAHTPYVRQLSFAQMKEFALRQLDREAAWLTALKTKVAADDGLTAAQQSAFTAKLDQALAAVASAQSAVQAATTPSELRAALLSALVPLAPYPRHEPVAHPRRHTIVQHRTPRKHARQVTLTSARVTDPSAVRAHRSVDVSHHWAGRRHDDRAALFTRDTRHRAGHYRWSGRTRDTWNPRDARDGSHHHSWYRGEHGRHFG